PAGQSARPPRRGWKPVGGGTWDNRPVPGKAARLWWPPVVRCGCRDSEGQRATDILVLVAPGLLERKHVAFGRHWVVGGTSMFRRILARCRLTVPVIREAMSVKQNWIKLTALVLGLVTAQAAQAQYRLPAAGARAVAPLRLRWEPDPSPWHIRALGP